MGKKPTPEEKGREKSPHNEGGCNRFTKGVTSTGAFALVWIVPEFAWCLWVNGGIQRQQNKGVKPLALVW